MKLGIGLIIIGTIFLWDGIIQLMMAGEMVFITGAVIKLMIGAVVLFFGIRRDCRKRRKSEKT